MNKISLTRIHEEIIMNLTEQKLLSKLDISEAKMQSKLLNRSFIAKLSGIVNKQAYDLENIFSLCSEIMIVPEKINYDKFVEFSYKYLLNKIFYDSVTIEPNIALEGYVAVFLKLMRIILPYTSIHEDPMYTYLNNVDTSLCEFCSFMDIYKKYNIYELIILYDEVKKSKRENKIKGTIKLMEVITFALNKSNIMVHNQYLYAAFIMRHISEILCEENDNLHTIEYIRQLCRENNFYNIQNIAINSSIGSLSRDYIPIEATIIIYSEYKYDEDFKIDSHEKLKIYDFELFLDSCGLNVNDLSYKDNISNFQSTGKFISLFKGDEIIKYLKKLSIFYNNKAFSIMESDDKFKEIIDNVRISGDKDTIKMYLSVIDEYAMYTDENKKKEAINLMYYLIINSDDEIKDMAAELLGKMIALLNQENVNEDDAISQNTEEYSLFIKYTDKLIHEDKVNIEDMVFYFYKYLDSFLRTLSGSCYIYIQHILDYFNAKKLNENSVSMLYIAIMNLDMKYFCEIQVDIIVKKMISIYTNSKYEMKLLIIYFINNVLNSGIINSSYYSLIKSTIIDTYENYNMCTSFLIYRIRLIIENNEEVKQKYNKFMIKNRNNISEIFLKNLKTATFWLEKIINIDFLITSLKESDDVVLLHTAAHLCNLVKVSAKEIVRNKAGRMLIDIGSRLSIDQRNEISVELLKGLEINEIKFSKYLPYFLGKFSLLLHPKELDELIEEINLLYLEHNVNLSILALETLTVIIQYYGKYVGKFDEESKKHDKRLLKMLGILTTGLIDENDTIKSYSLSLIGNKLFNSKVMNDKEKQMIFNIIIKKVLNLLALSEKENSIFTNAFALNSISKFINYFSLKYGSILINNTNGIAFYSNMFNPFSNGHKRIVRDIVKRGYDVYISIDEFNWMKKASPYMIRMNSIIKYTADDFNVFIFPDNIPINVFNYNDLQYLKNAFGCNDIKIVLEIETLVRNSINESKSVKNVISTCHYILYSPSNLSDDITKQYNLLKTKIGSNCIELDNIKIDELKKLPDICCSNCGIYSSKNVLSSKDYANQEYKQPVKKRKFNIEVINDLSRNIVDEIGHYIFMYTDLYENIGEELTNKNISILVIRDSTNSNRLIGFSAFHHISLKDLFHEFKNVEITNYIRKNTSGKIIIIDGMYTNPTESIENIEQILLMETLSYALKNDFTYAIYFNTLLNYSSDKIYEELGLHGFKKLDIVESGKKIYTVDMKFPICLTLDIENYIKEPLITMDKIKETIDKSRKDLKKIMTKLYPNNLIMSFNVDMLSSTLVEKICEINNDIKDDKSYGKYICVPYGNILKGKYIPNTITKSLHIEKFYDYSMREFEVLQSPLYSDISRQLDTIKSFDRPIILADDILHYGHEITGIDRMLKSKKLNVEKIVVAVLSSYGKDLMDMQNREVDYAYFIPNLRLWLKESMLCPFIGGYTIKGMSNSNDILIPSINNILPYSTPSFIEDADKSIAYDMSMLCLKNSKDIYEAIESEYEKIYERKLVLGNIDQAIRSPRYPAKGFNIYYDKNKEVSSYIKNDIENLIRIESIIKY